MSGLLMESVVALVTEWISLGEMLKLQDFSTFREGRGKGLHGVGGGASEGEVLSEALSLLTTPSTCVAPLPPPSQHTAPTRQSGTLSSNWMKNFLGCTSIQKPFHPPTISSKKDSSKIGFIQNRVHQKTFHPKFLFVRLGRFPPPQDGPLLPLDHPGPPFPRTVQNCSLFSPLSPFSLSWNCGTGRGHGSKLCHFVKPRRPVGPQGFEGRRPHSFGPSFCPSSP